MVKHHQVIFLPGHQTEYQLNIRHLIFFFFAPHSAAGAAAAAEILLGPYVVVIWFVCIFSWLALSWVGCMAYFPCSVIKKKKKKMHWHHLYLQIRTCPIAFDLIGTSCSTGRSHWRSLIAFCVAFYLVDRLPFIRPACRLQNPHDCFVGPPLYLHWVDVLSAFLSGVYLSIWVVALDEYWLSNPLSKSRRQQVLDGTTSDVTVWFMRGFNYHFVFYRAEYVFVKPKRFHVSVHSKDKWAHSLSISVGVSQCNSY